MLAFAAWGLALRGVPSTPAEGNPCPAPAAPSLADSLETRAAAALSQGHPGVARAALEQALALRRAASGPLSAAVARDLFDLGAVARAAGDLGRSARLFREALALREQLDGPDSFATSLALEGLASVLIDQQCYAPATTCLVRALAIRQRLFGNHHPQTARLHGMMGILDGARGRPAAAERHYVAATEAYRLIHGNAHERVAASLLNNGLLLEDDQDYAMAWVYYRQTLDMLRVVCGPGDPLVASALGHHARLAWKERRYADAAELYREALAIQRRFAGDAHPETARLLAGLARAEVAAGDDAAAVTTLRAAAHAYEAAWWLAGSGSERATFLGSPYPQLAAALARLGRAEEAWRAAERHNARLLALARRGAAGGDSLPVVSLAAVRGALRPGQALIGWVDAEVRPRGWETWGWVVRDRGPVRWHRFADGTRPTGPDAAARALRQALTAPDDLESDTADPAARLWRQRLALLMPDLVGVVSLAVVPAGALAGVPIELAGPPDAPPLGAVCTVSYAPSATLFVAGRSAAFASPPEGALVLADPPFSASMLAAMEREAEVDPPPAVATAGAIQTALLRSAVRGDADAIAGLPRLAGARREARSVAGLLGQATLLLGPDASEDSLEALRAGGALSRLRVLHFATHALVDADDPERSALVLSQADPTGPGDGLLTAGEIARNWRLDAELVTLSACETGLGRRVDGEGHLGLAHALLGAGVRTVLVSLWQVDDDATERLMRRFYENWTGHHSDPRAGCGAGVPLSKAAALREAKDWLRGWLNGAGRMPFAHPRYWSGFVLVGSPD